MKFKTETIFGRADVIIRPESKERLEIAEFVIAKPDSEEAVMVAKLHISNVPELLRVLAPELYTAVMAVEEGLGRATNATHKDN